MIRREFLKQSSVGSLGVLLGINGTSVPVTAQSDRKKPPVSKEISPPQSEVSGITIFNDNLVITSKRDGASVYVVNKEGITQRNFSVEGSLDSTSTILYGAGASSDSIYVVGVAEIDGGEGGYPSVFYKLNSDGTSEKTRTLSIPSPKGATYDGSYLWIDDNQRDGVIHQIDASGNVRQSLTLSETNNKRINGLTTDGEHFYSAAPNALYQFTMDGDFVDSYSYPRGSIQVDDSIQREIGLAHDGSNLWVARGDISKISALDIDSVSDSTSSESGTSDSPDNSSDEQDNSQSSTENDVKDTDGDGVIDSEDYAPRDPDIQRKEDLEQNDQNSGTSSQIPGFGLAVGSVAISGAAAYLSRKSEN